MKSLVFFASAAAAVACAMPAAAQQAASGPPSILVTGTGEAETQPDQFSIRLSVEGRGATQVDALRDLSAVQTRIMDAAPKLRGLSRATLTTGDASLEPVFDSTCGGDEYDRETDNCPIVGYRVSLPITMKGAPAERAGDALSLASELGARSAEISGYSVADMHALQEAANRAAFEDAERQARMLSDASGRRIVGILRIQDPSARLSGDDTVALGDVIVTGTTGTTARVSLVVAPKPVRATARLTVAFEIE
jgi:uncharacterized protein YggE